MPLQSKLTTLPTELLYITIRNLLDEWENTRRRGAQNGARNPLLTLALTCKRLERLACFILYRDISLLDERSLARLARSLRMSRGTRLGTFTESVVIGIRDGRATTATRSASVLRDAEEIVIACGNLRALALSEEFVPILNSLSAGTAAGSIMTRRQPHPVEITVLNLSAKTNAWMTYNSQAISTGFLSHVTHLTLAEPPEKWTDPLTALLTLPLAPLTLKHLTLSRKENSNSENDIIFLSCINKLLEIAGAFMDEYSHDEMMVMNRPEARFANLETVTIRIFPCFGYTAHDEDAELWIAAREMATKDSRIIVEKGYWGKWIDSWGRGRVY